MTGLLAFLLSISPFIRVGMCESGMNPTATNGVDWGAWQFDDTTWRATTGLRGHASDYGLAVQLEAAVTLQHQRGWNPWPRCGALA